MRFVGPALLLAAALLAAVGGLVPISAHTTFPLTTDGLYATSAPFRGQSGLYLITLEMDAIRDRHHTSCLMGGDLVPYAAPTGTIGTTSCDAVPRFAANWKLYSGNRLVAEDGPQSLRGVEAIVRQSPTKGRVERELGTFELSAFRSYQLRVREADVPPVLVGTNPIVRVGLHPWDVEQVLVARIGAFLLALLSGVSGLIWLGAAWRGRSVAGRA